LAKLLTRACLSHALFAPCDCLVHFLCLNFVSCTFFVLTLSGDDDDDALRLAYLTTNLPSNLPVKNRFRFDGIVAMGLWLTFWPTVYIRYGVATSYSALHRESKKQDTKLLTITSLTIIRCSKFFH